MFDVVFDIRVILPFCLTSMDQKLVFHCFHFYEGNGVEWKIQKYYCIAKPEQKVKKNESVFSIFF